MRRVHDVGGTQGFGPLELEENEPVFHEEWEGRVFGMMATVGHRAFPMRPTIESIEPATYLASTYYEKWLIALEKGFVQSGSITADELRDRVEFQRGHPNTHVSENRDSKLARCRLARSLQPAVAQARGRPCILSWRRSPDSPHRPCRSHPHPQIRSGQTRLCPLNPRRIRPARPQSAGHPQAGTRLHRRLRCS